MKRIITFILLLFQSGSAFSYNNFEEYFNAHVKSLSRSVVVFHYSNRNYMGFPIGTAADAQNPQRKENMEGRMVRFWDLAINDGGMAGNGLYAALDPVATRAYGGSTESFGLYYITLKQGAKFLDIRSQNSFPPEINSDLVQQGCVNHYNFSSLLRSQDSKCRDIIRLLFNKHNVSFLAYGYSATRYSFCNATDARRNTALVIVDPDAINYDESFVFVKQLPNDDKVRDARLKVKNYFKYMGTVKSKIDWEDSVSTQSNGDNDGIPQDFIDWVREHSFGCDAKYTEDAIL